MPPHSGAAQPGGGDLRLVFAVIKTVTDIERIGDQAKSVARMAIKMVEAAPEQPVPQSAAPRRTVRRNGAQRRSARSPGWTSNQALAVERADIAADAEYQAVMRELTKRMTTDARADSDGR